MNSKSIFLLKLNILNSENNKHIIDPWLVETLFQPLFYHQPYPLVTQKDAHDAWSKGKMCLFPFVLLPAAAAAAAEKVPNLLEKIFHLSVDYSSVKLMSLDQQLLLVFHSERVVILMNW